MNKTLKIALITFSIALLLIGFIGFALVGYLQFGGGKQIEPTMLGVMIESIENNTDEEVVFINAFTDNFFKIQPKETKQVNSWLPNSNYTQEFLGLTFDRGTLSHPANRFVFLHTKKGLMKLVVGKLYGFEIGYGHDTHLWVIREGGKNIKTVRGYSLIDDRIVYNKRKLIVDAEGYAYISPDGKQETPEINASRSISDLAWYKMQRSQEHNKIKLEFLKPTS